MKKSFSPYSLEFDNPQQVCKQVCLSIITKEECAKSLVNKPNRVHGDGDKSMIVGRYKGEEKQCSPERKSLIRTIFDLGGYILCFYDAQLVRSTAGILQVHQLLRDVFSGKELCMKGKDNKDIEALSEMYLIHMDGSCEVQDSP